MSANPIVDYWFGEAARGGVILEVGLDTGVDVLVAFADGRARFLNSNGDISMWEGGAGATSARVVTLLGLAEPLARNTAAQSTGRLPSPPEGEIRISVFSAAGMHVVEGRMDLLEDHLVFIAGVELMNALEGI